MADNENYEPVTTEPDSELGKMLYALNGNPVDVPYPTSEFTTILYALLGYEIEVPEPTSEASRLLYQYYIGGGSGDYQAKNIEPDFSNGNVVIVPDSGYDALSRVVIEKDAALLASNIKKDVEIFGITGTLENTVPQDLQDDMNSVFNKKFSTLTDYSPEVWADTVNLMGVLPTDTAQGAVANFPDGADNVPVKSLTAQIVATQEGTGDPSPSNVRPISGWSAVNVTRTGKNLFDIAGGQILNAYFGDTLAAYSVTRTVYVKCSPNTAYTVSKTAGQRFAVGYTKELPAIGVSVFGGTVDNTASSITITTGSDATYIVAYVFNSNNDSGTAEEMLNSVQIEQGTTATTYEAYNGTTYTRTFLDSNDDPVTVYGGSENLKTGEGASTCAFVEFDGSQDEPWVISSNETFFYLDGIEYKHDETQSAVMCSIFQPLPNGNSASFTGDNQCLFLLNTNNDRLYVKHTESTSVSDFRTFLSNNPMRLVYILATPQTFHTDPLNLDTLKGVNNIWADTGDTTVEYRADVQKYIDKKIAEAVSNRSLSLSKSAPEETSEK